MNTLKSVAMNSTATAALREIAEKYKTTSYALEGNVFDKHSNVDEIVADLTALISEGYVKKEDAGYPKEFLRYCIDHAEIESLEDTYLIDNTTRYYCMDDLYQWWKENVR